MANFTISNGILLGISYSKEEKVLTIPNTVKHIKKALILYSVEKLIIGPSVETIEANAFSEGIVLKEIVVDNPNFMVKDGCLFDVNQKTLLLAKRDIKGSLILPSTLEAIGDYAFAHCDELREVRINDNVSYIGTRAFFECFNLEKVNLPKNHELGLNGFTFQSTRIKEITIPKNITSLGRMDFYSCEHLKKVMVESAKIKNIPFSCFGYCKKILRIDFNNGVKTIEKAAFSDCPELTEITLPETVATIKGDNVFKNDSKLTVITSSEPLRTYCDSHGIPWL